MKGFEIISAFRSDYRCAIRRAKCRLSGLPPFIKGHEFFAKEHKNKEPPQFETTPFKI